MKRPLFLFFCLSVCVTLCANSDLYLLDQALEQHEMYEQRKQARIDSIRQNRMSLSLYDRAWALTNEYESYSYDSAACYVQQLISEAQSAQNPDKLAAAMIKQAFLYLSSGLFKEAADVFLSISPQQIVSVETKCEYYVHYARLCYDMADYVDGQQSRRYIEQGNQLCRNALALIDSTRYPVKYCSTAGLYCLRLGNIDSAIRYFRQALLQPDISDHDQAIAYASLGFLYQTQNDSIQALHCRIQAAIADLRSSTKETTALGLVAQQLYQQGDIERAVRYIRQALDDATFYNARHRQLSVSKILPIIEQQQLLLQQQHNRRIRILNACLYMLLLILCLALFFLYNRIRATIAAERKLQQMNQRLAEANAIKEECIATFLCHESSVYSKLEKYQRYVKKRTQEKRWDELTQIPQYADVRTLRNDFYRRFDTIFLHIFPNFIPQFNALLDSDKQITPKNGELLNAELRIFALIRLGINDNNQIAVLLDYSINTIYTYKTKVKNASPLSNEQFHKQLMQIV
ncbi:MAG: DUF6377 domain-containing protein [Paludibacteraceae bacterium]